MSKLDIAKSNIDRLLSENIYHEDQKKLSINTKNIRDIIKGK